MKHMHNFARTLPAFSPFMTMLAGGLATLGCGGILDGTQSSYVCTCACTQPNGLTYSETLSVCATSDSACTSVCSNHGSDFCVSQGGFPQAPGGDSDCVGSGSSPLSTQDMKGSVQSSSRLDGVYKGDPGTLFVTAGEIGLNGGACSGSCPITLTELLLTTGAGSAAGHNLSRAKLTLTQAVTGMKQADGTISFLQPFDVTALLTADGDTSPLSLHGTQISGTMVGNQVTLEFTVKHADEPLSIDLHLSAVMQAHPPAVAISAPSSVVCDPSTGKGTAHLVAVASDPDGDTVTVRWANQIAGLGQGPNFTASLPPGGHTFSVVGEDPGGRIAFAQADVTVIDTLPPLVALAAQAIVYTCGAGALPKLPTPGITDLCAAEPVTVKGEVLSVNGQPISPLLIAADGRVNAPHGVLGVRWTTLKANGQQVVRDQVVLVTENPAIHALDSVAISDRAVIGRVSGADGAIFLDRQGTIDVGADAATGPLTSLGNILLRDRSRVHGPAIAGGTIVQQNQVQVSSVWASAVFPGLSWPVLSPVIVGSTAVMVEPGSSRTLQPGQFGAVQVKARATLVVSAGRYSMTSLKLEAGSTVRVQGSAVPVFAIRDTALLQGVISGSTGALAPVELDVSGISAELDSPFVGSVIVPGGSLTLAGSTANGSFVGKTVAVRPGVVVTGAPTSCN